MIAAILGTLFGRDRNVLRETVQVFRENVEAGAQRAHVNRSAALQQFASEFRTSDRSTFDSVMDGVNRLPRPLLALATLALLASAMIDPVWFSARMQGLSLVPEPLWWLLGVIVSFYFGARHQVKSQEFQRSLAQTMVHLPDTMNALASLAEPQMAEGGGDRSGAPERQAQEARTEAKLAGAENAALSAWRQSEQHNQMTNPTGN